MNVAKRLRRDRNVAYLAALLVCLFLPAVLYGSIGLPGAVGGAFAGMLLAVLAVGVWAIPSCPYCGQNLLEKRGAGGVNWFSPTIPKACPGCGRDLE